MGVIMTWHMRANFLLDQVICATYKFGSLNKSCIIYINNIIMNANNVTVASFLYYLINSRRGYHNFKQYEPLAQLIIIVYVPM